MRVLLLTFMLLISVPLDAVAQQPEQSNNVIYVSQPPDTKKVQKAEPIKNTHPKDMQSLLFTYWEHIAIRDARRSRGLVRAPTEDELMKDLKNEEDENRIKPPPEERDIRLGGIVYVSDDDWTIWLNGKRVTPQAIPKEILDLLVYDEYIELKWFDEWSYQIFPIRLRANQRFNIDTRIFLPG